MDAFKLLTRSAKINPARSSSRRGPRNLPSAGQSATPLLFGDPAEDADLRRTSAGHRSSRKRKRSQHGTDQNDRLAEGLDFFKDPAPIAPDDSSPRDKGDSESNRRSDALRADHDIDDSVPTAGEALSKEESRRVLKSHKIKIIRVCAPASDKTSASSHPMDSVGRRKTAESERRKRSSTGRKDRTPELIPRPLLSFEQLRSSYGISRRLAENIAAEGYRFPTEVQMASLPLLLRRDRSLGPSSVEHRSDSADTDDLGPLDLDLVAVAPTGSGKTVAYLIPVLDGLRRMKNRSTKLGAGTLQAESAACVGPSALVIVPTKELLGQVLNEGRKLSRGTGIKIAGVRKGMAIALQREVPDPGRDGSEADSDDDDGDDDDDDDDNHAPERSVVKADILVSTPMALLHAASSGEDYSEASLPTVRHLVLDEADVLLDPLFREQTLAVWRACSRPSLRVSHWSATMGSSIEELVAAETRTRKSTADGASVGEWQLVRLVVGVKDSAVPNVSHRLVYAATEPGKLLAMRQLLHPSKALSRSAPPLRPPVLVFTQTIARAVALHSELLYDIPPQAGGSSRIAVLHSDLSDAARDRVTTGFRTGEIWVIVTTDLLSRGIDFRGVNGVVNYDVPTSTAAYIHRGGRTGRAGRSGGIVVTLYTTDDIPHIKSVANVIAATEKLRAGSEDDASTLPAWLMDALPKQSRADKKRLRRRGVESRRPPSAQASTEDGKATKKTAARISTRSGYDRRLGNRRLAAVKSRARRSAVESDQAAEAQGEWNGIEG